jgi:short-subunit dehydrogenase
MATTLVQNGANVIIASRKEKALKEVADELNALGKGRCDYVIYHHTKAAACILTI